MLLFILLPAFLIMLCFGLKILSDECFYDDMYPSQCETEREKARYERGRQASDGWLQWVLIVIGGLGALVVIIATLCMVDDVAQLKVIDQKIAVYEQENTRIEQSVATMVENYINHETNTFAEISKDISPTMVFSMYPELKSNTLVEKEISIYTENQKELRELKLSRYDKELAKWWLWFG